MGWLQYALPSCCRPGALGRKGGPGRSGHEQPSMVRSRPAPAGRSLTATWQVEGVQRAWRACGQHTAGLLRSGGISSSPGGRKGRLRSWRKACELAPRISGPSMHATSQPARYTALPCSPQPLLLCLWRAPSMLAAAQAGADCCAQPMQFAALQCAAAFAVHSLAVRNGSCCALDMLCNVCMYVCVHLCRGAARGAHHLQVSHAIIVVAQAQLQGQARGGRGEGEMMKCG